MKRQYGDLACRAAYGGEGWQARTTSLADELGTYWGACGLADEWSTLRAVLLHRPGVEIDAGGDPDASLMLEPVRADVAAAEHDALAHAYRAAGVDLLYVSPSHTPPPNLMFVADLMFMTPAGAIVGRPASPVRAGEERWVARALAEIGVPILRTVGGTGTFEGADAMWIDRETVLVARGLRTNVEGATQVAATLGELGARAIDVELTPGTMHLMGQLRVVDRDLAYAWAGRVPPGAIRALEERGMRVLPFPDEDEALLRHGHNFVTLGPRRIVMPSGCPVSEAAYRREGVDCVTVDVSELTKAAGGIGCLTGVLRRG